MNRRYIEIGNQIGKEFNDYLLEYIESCACDPLDSITNSNYKKQLYKIFVERKLSITKIHLRASWVYFCSMILLGKKFSINKLLPTMISIELCMWSAYAYNWLIDNKNYDLSENPKNRASNLVVMGYLMQGDIFEQKISDKTKITLLKWLKPIGIAYGAETFTRITDHGDITN